MGVNRFQDLHAWRLARDVKLRVYALVDSTRAKTDFNFCDQIKDSAASAPSAISEGFGRYSHPEFAYFLRVAKSSLTETQSHLLDGVDRKHWKRAEADPVVALADRAIGAITNLLKHLITTDAPGQRKSRRP